MERSTEEISGLTGYTINTVKIYFRLIDWGLDNKDASRIAKGLGWLGVSASFTEGLPWWIPKLEVELSLVVGLACSIAWVGYYAIT